VAWCAAMRIMIEIGDLVQRTGDGRTGQVLGCRAIERSGWRRVWSAPCTWKQGSWVSWLSLKTKVNGLSMVWQQNHWDGFLLFGIKTVGDSFSRFGLKTDGSGFPV
jgi:hypothetical protein